MYTRIQEILIQTILPIFSGFLFSFLIFFQFTYTNPLSQLFLGDIKRNQWIAHFDQSMKGQNPWLRNYVAFTGLLGSVRPEIIYLETMHDDSNTPLLGTNDYILKGTAPDCRYWSFVTYDFQNGRIEPHQQTIASSHRTTLNDLCDYEIIITDDKKKYPNKKTIIHSGQDFNIVMRIYGPEPSYYETKDLVPVGSISPLK